MDLSLFSQHFDIGLGPIAMGFVFVSSVSGYIGHRLGGKTRIDSLADTPIVGTKILDWIDTMSDVAMVAFDYWRSDHPNATEADKLGFVWRLGQQLTAFDAEVDEVKARKMYEDMCHLDNAERFAQNIKERTEDRGSEWAEKLVSEEPAN